MKIRVNRELQLATVTLSERNLRALLFKLEQPHSKRTLCCDDGGWTLVVTAENDADHYTGRPEGPPGVMEPATEKHLEEVGHGR